MVVDKYVVQLVSTTCSLPIIYVFLSYAGADVLKTFCIPLLPEDTRLKLWFSGETALRGLDF